MSDVNFKVLQQELLATCVTKVAIYLPKLNTARGVRVHVLAAEIWIDLFCA